jgi:NAD(P)-dependent dehydrogenase (short-subunit alcohol dehydrogenase family)
MLIRPMSRLAGKVIVIVGGTTGLGLSAAKACANEGARLVLVGRNPESAEAAQQALGEKVFVMTGNAIEPRTADAAIANAVARFGRFDGIYHVAGGSGRKFGDGPLHEITDDGWTATLDLNQRSVFNSSRAAVRYFLEHKQSGVVLNMGSVLGWSPSPKFFTTHAYAAAKGAIIGLTKAAAAYYASDNIRFNVIAPALVETPMAQRAANDETILEFIKTKQPLDGGRIGRPEDLDDAVVWLLSDGSKFVTGQVIAVDGGWTVSEGQIP